MTRDEAWSLLCEYTQSENLRRHALAVEACMRYYARLFGEALEGVLQFGVARHHLQVGKARKARHLRPLAV